MLLQTERQIQRDEHLEEEIVNVEEVNKLTNTNSVIQSGVEKLCTKFIML